MNDREYVRLSLELHLFFDRIMKEHSLFLQAAFVDKNDEFKKIALDFQNQFSDILNQITNLADGNISNSLILAEEFVTNNTLAAENQTSNLSGININTNITLNQLNLNSGNLKLTDQLLYDINTINQKTLPLILNLIQFKNDILNQVLSCQMYTFNYPLLIKHIMDEAKMYYNLLTKIENRETYTENYLYEQELFWNNIMKEHAEFIRGLLDPSENQLITQADYFSKEYDMILNKYTNNLNSLTEVSLNETINFRNFKLAGEEGILNCQIKSIIIPLLADHVVREANHFLRILNSSS